MNAVAQNPTKGRKRAVIKALVFVVFILAAIYIIRFTPVKGLLTREALGHLLESAGPWAPLFLYLSMASGCVCSCQGLCSLPWGLLSSALTGDFCMSG